MPAGSDLLASSEGAAQERPAVSILGARLTAAGHPQADTWSCSVKATAVDTANRTVGELSLLVGATGFQADCTLARARADLGGLLYADGIHDSLLRSVGRTLTTVVRIPAPHTVQVPQEQRIA